MVVKKSKENSETPLENEEYNAELIAKQVQETERLAETTQESNQHIEPLNVLSKEYIYGQIFPIALQFEQALFIKALNEVKSFARQIEETDNLILSLVESLQSYFDESSLDKDDQELFLRIYLGFLRLRGGAIEVGKLYGQPTKPIFDWLFQVTKSQYKRVKSLI